MMKIESKFVGQSLMFTVEKDGVSRTMPASHALVFLKAAKADLTRKNQDNAKALADAEERIKDAIKRGKYGGEDRAQFAEYERVIASVESEIQQIVRLINEVTTQFIEYAADGITKQQEANLMQKMQALDLTAIDLSHILHHPTGATQ